MKKKQKKEKEQIGFFSHVGKFNVKSQQESAYEENITFYVMLFKRRETSI